MHDGAFGEHCGERTRDEVRTVVGEDLIDSHVVGPEPVLGASPEPDEGDGGFVVVGFDVGDTGVVVDRDMEIGVAHAAAAGAFGLLRTAPVDAPAASWGYLADLFDVEVSAAMRSCPVAAM